MRRKARSLLDRVHLVLVASVLFGGAPGLRAEVPADLCPLRAGEGLPAAAVLDVWGKSQQLRTVAAGRERLYIFHLGGGHEPSVRFLRDLQQVAPELQKLGFETVLLGPGTPPETAELVRRLGVTPGFRLLADDELSAAAAFGLVYQPAPAGASAAGTDLAEKPEGAVGAPSMVPAMYIVDKEDRVRFAHIDTRPARRLAPAVLLAAARSVREQDGTP